MSRNSPPKRSAMTLDLNSGPSASKKAKLQQILTSPDVQMLKLTSPELAEFLTRNPSLATPTPSGFVFPKTVTEEQEMYAKGFEEALKKLHTTNNEDEEELPPPPPPPPLPVTTAPTTTGTTTNTTSEQQQHQPSFHNTAILTIERATSAHSRLSNNPVSTISATTTASTLPPSATSQDDSNLSRPSSAASGSFDSSSLDGSSSYVLPDPLQIKEEPGAISSSTTTTSPNNNDGMEPIDMETQEKIKLERKRLRNRVAASKCRKRKLERISQLDGKVNLLKGENSELANVVKKLKEAVCNLKEEVLEHVRSGCEIMISDMPAFAAE